MPGEAGARLLRLLEEVRADAKAGFVNKAAPWRRRRSEVAPSEDLASEDVERQVSVLSADNEAQVIEALEAELLGDMTTSRGSAETADPILGDLLDAIEEAVGGDDLEDGIRQALASELRRSEGGRY